MRGRTDSPSVLGYGGGMDHTRREVHDRHRQETGTVEVPLPARKGTLRPDPITERFEMPEGRRWIANHLRELADRVGTDLEIIGFEGKWDSFNERFEVTFSYRQVPGEPVPERPEDSDL